MKLEIGKIYKYIGPSSYKALNRYLALGVCLANDIKDIYNHFPKNDDNEISFDNPEQVYFKLPYVEIKNGNVFKIENFSSESIQILFLDEEKYYKSVIFSPTARLLTDAFSQEFIDNCIELKL